jgi:hypothetical protein
MRKKRKRPVLLPLSVDVIRHLAVDKLQVVVGASAEETHAKDNCTSRLL